MDNLIIGETAQLNYYFPSSYKRISSRNIDYNSYKNTKFDSVYILFAEQRTFLNSEEEFFTKVNVNYTLEVVNFFKEIANKVVLYSTSELWNDYAGGVDVSQPFKYNYSAYIKSKEILSNTINDKKDMYKNVHIIYPFNFNSPYRKEGFLFYKIFDSIINKTKQTIGNIDMFRDVIHPSIIVKESISTTEDKLVGMGELINIKTYVEDMFTLVDLKCDDYLISNVQQNLPNTRKEYFSAKSYSSYNELMSLSFLDIKKFLIN
jgi:GDP-D-mannose dehydratase